MLTITCWVGIKDAKGKIMETFMTKINICLFNDAYLSTFNYPKSGDFMRFIIWASFTAFCLVPILATRGQVSSLV